MDYKNKLESELIALNANIKKELKELLHIIERFTLTDSHDDNYVKLFNQRTDQQVKIQKMQAESKGLLTKIQSLKA